MVPILRGVDSSEIVWRDKIRSWAASYTDCLWLDRVELYRECRVAGIVQRMRLDPGERELRSTITDGSSFVTASWPLTRRMAQLKAAPGSGLILQGMARIDATGEIVFVEPGFEIVQGPEV